MGGLSKELRKSLKTEAREGEKKARQKTGEKVSFIIGGSLPV